MAVRENPILIQPARGLPKWLGVIGAGTIGPDIAYYLKSAIADLHLVLIDINEDALAKAVERIHAYADKGVARGKLSNVRAQAVRENIHAATDYEALAYCDWVIEAATENLELKKDIFSRVEAIVGSDTLITSNTSSIPARRLFSDLQFPQRTTVTHFFAPAYRNPAVEVIEWEKADPANIQYLRWLFCATDKVPLLSRDVVCFMLDRIFDNWCNEAALLLDPITPAQVDTVAGRYVHGGPFFVLNLANGNPIIVETNTLQMQEEGEDYRPATVFKSSATWDTVKPGGSVDVDESTGKHISDRLLGILFSQAVGIIDRRIGTRADLDLGSRLAFGFKQGPLELMRELGESEVKRILGRFCQYKPGMPQPEQHLSAYSDFRRFVLVDDLDGIKVITLRRPDALNALHDEMTDEILQVFTAFDTDPGTRGFIITGYGTRSFCAGADIGKFPAMLGNRHRSVEYARACSRLLRYLDACPKPVVAALNGMALGGGLELAVRCQGLVATKNAWLQFPEITLGIVPGIGAMVVPYRRWPHAAATFHNMLIKAEKVSAGQATSLGIIDTLVDDHANLIQAALWLAGELQTRERPSLDGPVRIAPIIAEINEPLSSDGRRLSSRIVTLMREAIQQAAAAATLAEALEIGYQAFGDSALTAAAREGISAFSEHRQPDFATTG